MRAGNKKFNDYADVIDPALYAATPKAVLAALVVSLMSDGGDRFDDSDFDVNAKIREEWGILHGNGIVPQRPPKGTS